VRPEDVCERAGVRGAELAAEFCTMVDLLRALADRMCSQRIATTEEATRAGIWAGTPPRDVVAVAVRSIIDTIFQREALIREMLSRGGRDPAFSAGLCRIGADLAARLTRVLPECAGHPRVEPRRLAFALSTAAAIGHQAILLARDWSGECFTPDEIAERATHVVCGDLAL
jgi:hypothetical protein